MEVPERVPFRLTQNIIDGLGITGVEGVFRIACEMTMQLLRDNKDSLMSVLDAFIHDPLVEWEDEKRKMVSEKVSREVRPLKTNNDTGPRSAQCRQVLDGSASPGQECTSPHRAETERGVFTVQHQIPESQWKWRVRE